MTEIMIIALIILALGVIYAWKLNREGKQHETNYQTLFTIGVVWLPIGIATNNPVFFILGTVFTITGVVNSDKW